MKPEHQITLRLDRALIVKKEWLDLILSGEKTWEIRGSNTAIRGRIGLIESGTGTIVGECELTNSFWLDKTGYHAHYHKHKIPSKFNSTMPYHDKTHAWVLENPKRYDNPYPYNHPKGAIIWVKFKVV
jgi:hypothetical protein